MKSVNNRPRETKQRRPRETWKMTSSGEQCDQMLCMAKAEDLESVWCHWNRIADRVIPPGYDPRDCLGDINFDPNYSDGTAQDILRRIGYLSDRLDPARCFALDYKIREHLGLEQR